ncbi:MAG: outer membrane lipoprotein carrier protein LolA [Bacteroidales bacterium]|jgi:outer membrane lipoprotein-sorting protein|nr:outer membrane lipoprotein carrier protein LolA [Bacteroidales bacterium]
MKKTGILIVLELFFYFVFAQQPAQTRKYQDMESVAILKELQRNLSSFSSISIDFTFRSEKNEKFIDEITGSVLVKGNKYVLKTGQQLICCDGTNLWNYLPEQKEVTVSLYDKEDDDQMMNPLNMIQNYEKYYKSNFIREVIEKGILIQVIDLTPLEASSYYKVRLVLDKTKKQLMRLTVYEKEGIQYTYVVNKFVINQSLSDEQFSFDLAKYPGVELIDIR